LAEYGDSTECAVFRNVRTRCAASDAMRRRCKRTQCAQTRLHFVLRGEEHRVPARRAEARVHVERHDGARRRKPAAHKVAEEHLARASEALAKALPKAVAERKRTRLGCVSWPPK
jgi:hypothetical protein